MHSPVQRHRRWHVIMFSHTMSFLFNQIFFLPFIDYPLGHFITFYHKDHPLGHASSPPLLCPLSQTQASLWPICPAVFVLFPCTSFALSCCCIFSVSFSLSLSLNACSTSVVYICIIYLSLCCSLSNEEGQLNKWKEKKTSEIYLPEHRHSLIRLIKSSYCGRVVWGIWIYWITPCWRKKTVCG